MRPRCPNPSNKEQSGHTSWSFFRAKSRGDMLKGDSTEDSTVGSGQAAGAFLSPRRGDGALSLEGFLGVVT